MKVLITVATLSFGGAERTAANVSRLLAGKHDVTILAFHGNVTYPHAGRVIDLKMPYAPDVTMIWKTRRLYEKVMAYRRVYRDVQPDVVLSFTEGPNIIALLNKQAGIHSKVIINTQVPLSRLYKGTYRLIYGTLIRRLYRQADCIVALSEGVRSELISQFHVPESKAFVINNPVDVAHVQMRSAEPIEDTLLSDGVPIILSVGRLSPEKNHQLLLRAFAIVTMRQNAKLALIGQGPLEHDLRELARKLGIEDKVVFLGWQDNPFMYMSRAAVFAMSSDYEGFGNVLVEAMACGCPVVSTNCSFGPSEILENGKYGILVPVENEQALAEGICQVLSDAKLRQSLSEKGRLRAKAFGIDVIGSQFLHLVEEFAQPSPS